MNLFVRTEKYRTRTQMHTPFFIHQYQNVRQLQLNTILTANRSLKAIYTHLYTNYTQSDIKFPPLFAVSTLIAI